MTEEELRAHKRMHEVAKEVGVEISLEKYPVE